MRERTLIGKVPVDIPEVIPPHSLVVLRAADEKTPEWKKDVGRKFRVGYYSRRDGLDCVWLVNEKGKYEQTTDRLGLLRYFSIEKLSRERDFYGDSKPASTQLKFPRRSARSKA